MAESKSIFLYLSKQQVCYTKTKSPQYQGRDLMSGLTFKAGKKAYIVKIKIEFGF